MVEKSGNCVESSYPLPSALAARDSNRAAVACKVAKTYQDAIKSLVESGAELVVEKAFKSEFVPAIVAMLKESMPGFHVSTRRHSDDAAQWVRVSEHPEAS